MFAKQIICYICGENITAKTQYHLNLMEGEQSLNYAFCSEEHLKIFQGETETEELESE